MSVPSINFACILGTIKGEVRHHTTPKSQVANLTLVTQQKAHPNAKVDYFTTYHNITAWGKLAEVVQHATEGTLVQVEGALETESWEQDGTKRYKTIVKAHRLSLLEEEPQQRRNPVQQMEDTDESPF
ncbi:single-stranded DNA-binding protein [uncultured Mediterranean phage uvDeep-CGR2-KM23-C246]|nr:single-stranded DNA-binding protein [uncultured Mediterranean phage uvDeep-CGR2-KM23-C246]